MHNTDSAKQHFNKDFTTDYLLKLGYNHIFTISGQKMRELFQLCSHDEYVMVNDIFSKCRIFRLGPVISIKNIMFESDPVISSNEKQSFVEVNNSRITQALESEAQYYFYTNVPEIQEQIKDLIFIRMLVI